MAIKSSFILFFANLVAAGPVILPRTVTAVDPADVAQAQQRDDTATRAFSNVQITTSDGQCLFVNPLSGDFRENLTPIQVAACGSTSGQGWDVITAGKHNNVAGSMLIVSTLTEACFNFDPRRAAGNQVLLFSCGGRADGSGAVTTSQLFPFSGNSTMGFEPENSPGSCLVVNGDVLDVATCDLTDATQSFTFGGSAGASAPSNSTASEITSVSSDAPATTIPATTTAAAETTQADIGSSSAPASITSPAASACGPRRTFTSFVTVTASDSSQVENAGVPDTSSTPEATSITSVSSEASVAAATSLVLTSTTGEVTAIPTPTVPVPVSRGGTLNPSAAAAANPRDNTATRAFTNATIKAPNGQCLFVDPTAGDFRENLIPISLVDCAGTPNEKWDVITAGQHDDQPGSALIVSSLMNGCISFDGRRAAGDTVTVFSCGGRADGTGATDTSQLMPFDGAESFAFAPESENNQTCIIPGPDNTRLISGPCPTDGSQLFAVFP